jgi:transposase
MPPAPNTIKANAKDRRKKARKDGNPSGALSADLDRQKALKWREEGMSYRDIAAKLGVSLSTAYKYVNDGWERVNEETDESRRVVRAMEEDNLDAMLKVALPLATKNNLLVITTEFTADGPVEVRKEDAELQFKAIDRVLKIGKRRAEIRGTDAPVKIENQVSGSALEPLEVLAQRVAEAKAKQAQA